MAFKRLAVVPAEGLLTEPVLKHARVAPHHQTAARDPVNTPAVPASPQLPASMSTRTASPNSSDRLHKHSISVVFPRDGDGHRSFSASLRNSSVWLSTEMELMQAGPMVRIRLPPAPSQANSKPGWPFHLQLRGAETRAARSSRSPAGLEFVNRGDPWLL